jgi:hypothetical protein
MMREPHELMAATYAGPSRLVRLADLPNQVGFRFTGVDREGGEHKCEVRKNPVGCHGVYRLDTGEPFFVQLCGWIPEAD